MSADLSDPAVITAVKSISDPVSPISLIALEYHHTVEKTLILLSTGFDPWVPHWRELIGAHKSEPLFGYGVVAKGRPLREGGEKGVILVYLPEEVTGVRRARAVVHSRALANKFPDYSAIITISDSSQISEEFVRDQVNFYNQPVATPTSSPVKPRAAAQLGLGLGHKPLSPAETDSAVPFPTTRAIQPSSSSTRSFDRPLPPPPAEPLDLPLNPRLDTPTPPRMMTPPPGSRQSSESVPAEHSRKDSLSSRFAKVLPSFTKADRSERTASGGGESPKSPKSPSRFETFTSGFGTGRKTSGQESRRAVSGDELGEFGASRRVEESYVSPPRALPKPPTAPSKAYHESPRDEARVNLSSPPNDVVGDSSLDQPGSSYAASPQLGDSLPPPLPPKTSNVAPQPPAFNRLHTLGAIVPNPTSTQYTRPYTPSKPASSSAPIPDSPTAAAALATAREKQVDAETRMHDEFRRTEEERTRIRVNSGNRNAGIVRTPTPMQGLGDYDSEEEGLPYDRPEKVHTGAREAGVHGDRMESMISQPHQRDEMAQANHVPISSGISDVGGNIGSNFAAGELASSRGVDEEEDTERRRVEEEEAQVQARQLAAERALERERLEEATRQKEVEQTRERREKEDQDNRLREIEEEARIQRLAEEQELQAAKRAEEEKARIALQLQAEAEALANAKEAERVRTRKQEALRESLKEGKSHGEVMLRGHVTVQTLKSIIWRRRHFQLLASEMRLYKKDTDPSPIQIISLAPGTKVSQTYEESSVQGSFKIISTGIDGDSEDFFVFADSAEEKELLLEGLNVALGL